MSDPNGSDQHPYGDWEGGYQPMGQQPPPQPPQGPPAYHQAYGASYGPVAPQVPSGKRQRPNLFLLFVMVLATGVMSSILTAAVIGGIGSAPPDPKRPSITATGTVAGEHEHLESVLDSVFTVAVRSQTVGGTGSGVAIDENHIVTNAHVVNLGGSTKAKDPTIEVQDALGHEHAASLVGVDTVADVAVLRVDDMKLTPMEWGDSSNLVIGQGVVAVGAPLGLSNTVTSGIVSALNRPVELSEDEDAGDTSGAEPTSTYINAIQTDAAINHGNSGGPLIDTDGKLIGLNVAISSAEGSTGSIGIGYAIPSSYVKRVAGELIKNGEAAHGLLDVSVVTAGSASQIFEDGALVKEITKGGAASSSSLRKGDVIVGWEGEPVPSAGSLIGFAKSSAPGSKVTLTVRRGTREIGVDVTLGSDLD